MFIKIRVLIERLKIWVSRKEFEKANFDMTLYGACLVEKKWWGYKHIPDPHKKLTPDHKIMKFERGTDE